MQSTFGLLGDVDFAFLEPLDQIVRREVDQFDSIGAIENSIGHCLTDPDVRDLSHYVVEAFDVLNVNGRVNVDAVAHQFFDIEITFGMAAAFGIGMRQLINQYDLWTSLNDGVDIHLGQRLPFILNLTARDDLQAR